MHTCVHVCVPMHVPQLLSGDRGQLAEISSFLLPCRVLEMKLKSSGLSVNTFTH